MKWGVKSLSFHWNGSKGFRAVKIRAGRTGCSPAAVPLFRRAGALVKIPDGILGTGRCACAVYPAQEGKGHFQLNAPHFRRSLSAHPGIALQCRAGEAAVRPVRTLLQQKRPQCIHFKIEIIFRKGREGIQKYLQAAVQANHAVWPGAGDAGIGLQAPQPEMQGVGCAPHPRKGPGAAAAAPGELCDGNGCVRHF